MKPLLALVHRHTKGDRHTPVTRYYGVRIFGLTITIWFQLDVETDIQDGAERIIWPKKYQELDDLK